MEFAKRELEKYGWTEGRGLGKNENGIVKALKPKLKFDNAGLGHDISDEYNNQWWQKLYDEASRNIVAEEENNEVIIKTRNSLRHKKKKTKKQHSDLQNVKYKGFIKTSNMDGFKEKRLCKFEFDDEVSISGNEDKEKMERLKEKGNKDKTDLLSEELFKVCGGRTAHKGARHGLKMSAKLARIEEQEKNLMNSTVNAFVNGNEFSDVTKKKKKKKLK